VLATRGALRRLTGLITIALGAGVAATSAGQVTRAAMLAAAGRSGSSPATGAGAGTAAGSVTAGNGGSSAGSIAGFPVHVVLGGTGWRVLLIAGAALIIAAGLAVMIGARRLPVMTGRYERRGRQATGQDSGQTARPRAAASMWESLNAGTDPTATGPD
jgi:Tryptophan-associated transmembrane protein (Trp_oprn_chp)